MWKKLNCNLTFQLFSTVHPKTPFYCKFPHSLVKSKTSHNLFNLFSLINPDRFLQISLVCLTGVVAEISQGNWGKMAITFIKLHPVCITEVCTKWNEMRNEMRWKKWWRLVTTQCCLLVIWWRLLSQGSSRASTWKNFINQVFLEDSEQISPPWIHLSFPSRF